MDEHQATKQWFKKARLGMFIHWGVASLLGRGEWVMRRDGIPAEEYCLLADEWNPLPFAPELWCRAAAAAGLKYVVFTARHHDGFALFKSTVDSFNSYHTSAGCDYVAEFVAACRKYQLGVGIYYSLLDWRASLSGRKDDEWGAEMKAVAIEQIRELMTQYGKIDLLWYDGACAPGLPPGMENRVALFWESEKLNAMVRQLQPGILINDRSGTRQDFQTLEGINIIRPPANAELWEVCLTLSDDDFSYWGYCRSSLCRRTAAQTIRMLLHTIEYGGNFLINCSPDEAGQIPPWQLEILEELGRWVGKNREAVYEIERTEIARENPHSLQGNSCGFFTRSGQTLFFYMYEWPGSETRIPYLQEKIARVSFLQSGQDLPFTQEPNGALSVLGMPEYSPELYCTVLKMTVE